MSNRARSQAGFSLLELILATLIVAFIGAGLLGAVLASSRAGKLDADRLVARQTAASLRVALRGYAVAWEPGADPKEEELAALDTGMLGLLGCSGGCRRLPGDGCAWALATDCEHDAGALLPASFRAAPRNGRLTYTVSLEADGSRSIAIKTSWRGS